MTPRQTIAALIVVVLAGWLLTVAFPGGDLSHPLTTEQGE